MFCRLAALILCTVLLATGCSSDGKRPQTLKPAPHRSGSTTSSSPSTPLDDRAAIAALASDYVAESNRALNTGDTAKLRAMSTTDCPCLAAIRYVEAAWAKGSIRALDYYRSVSVASPVMRSSTDAVISVAYSTGSEVHFDKSGRPIASYPPDPRRESASVETRKVRGVWRVADVVRN